MHQLAQSRFKNDFGFYGQFVEFLTNSQFQAVQAFFFKGRDHDRLFVMGSQDVNKGAIRHLIGLVQNHDRGVIFKPQISQNFFYSLDLLFSLGAGGIHHMQQQIGLTGLFQSRLERRHE